MVAIFKMAAIFVTGRIWDGPLSKSHQWGIVCLRTKFHACFIKPTIFSPICSTMVQFYNESHTNTHPFNGRFSGTVQVSRYQKGKTNLDFTEARDSEWQWHQLGHIICKSAPHSRQITMPAPHCSVFYRPDALPAAQPTASKYWRQFYKE